MAATVPEIPEIEIAEPDIPPEVRLARAVLWRAYEDIGISNWAAKTTHGAGGRVEFDAETEVRGPARRFCVAMFDPFLEDRTYWTDAADIPEPLYRALCRRKIAEIRQAEAENRTAKVIELNRAFEALVAESDSMDGDQVEAMMARLAHLEVQVA